MSTLTIQEAAETTGWSPRMLRYIEQVGLVAAPRSAGGYRLYGPAELQRLRTLRELLQRFDIGLTDVGFALRLRRDEELRAALDEWFEARPVPPADIPADDWLRWEYDKHQKLLAEIPVEQRSRPAPVDAPTGAYPIVDIPDETGTYPVVDISDDEVRARPNRAIRPGAHRHDEENR